MNQNLKICQICSEPLPKGFRKFCSKRCREKSTYQKWKLYQKEWQTKQRDKQSEIPSPDKVKCLVCGRYYIQVGTHIIWRHGITARKYREDYDLPVSRGIVPLYYRAIKGEIAKTNKTYLNLFKGGRPFRFKKGSERAKINTFYKGRYAESKNLPQEIYPHHYLRKNG